jgi:hypothetical protein
MTCTKTKLHGLCPRANYIDRATAVCRRSDCQLFADGGCHVVSVTYPYGRILGFLDRSRYFFYQVAPQLYSRGWVDPVPDTLLFFILVVPESNPGLRICSQELWSLDHRGGPCTPYQYNNNHQIREVITVYVDAWQSKRVHTKFW